MLIKDILNSKDVVISFEVFPPKSESPLQPVLESVKSLSEHHPDYISVTYGAGGGTSKNSVEIASYIQNDLNALALSHLTCVSSSKKEIADYLAELKLKGIYNILALRGDIPHGVTFPEAGYYDYAYQLIEDIKSFGSFCVGAACYPEGHVESQNKQKDIAHLKQKVECGCDFLITQMFFDNNVLYDFLYNALARGIYAPVIAGVMPVTNIRQIKRMIQLSGTTLSPKFKRILDRFGENPMALKQAGIAYATDQIVDLIANGVKGIHLYTMNKPDVAKGIMNNLSDILK